MGNSGGGGSKSTTTQRIPDELSPLVQASADFALERIPQGATPLPFDLVPETPELLQQQFDIFAQQLGGDNAAIIQALQAQISGEGAFEPDFAAVSERFQSQILDPTVQAVSASLGQDTRNALNQPGRFFASDTAANVGRAVGAEVGRTTGPLAAALLEGESNRAFQSQQNALSRVLPAASTLQGLPATQFQQAAGASDILRQVSGQNKQILASEFLRLAEENNPFVQAGLGIAGQFGLQTTTTSVTEGSGSGLGTALGAGLGLLLAAPTGGASLLAGGGLSTASLIGASAGGGIGGLF